MIKILFELIFKILFLVFLGYMLCRRGILEGRDQRSMTSLLIKVVVYFLIIMSSQNEFSLEAAAAMRTTMLVAALSYMVEIPVIIFIAERLDLSADKKRIFVCSSIFCNVTFMGYPISQELLGDTGLLCAVVYSMVYNVLFYTWGFFYLNQGKKICVKEVLTNKIAICSILALFLYFMRIQIPPVLRGTFTVIGQMTFPLSMLILGCSLADSDLWDILKDRQLYIITLLRMLIIPGITYMVLRSTGLSKPVIQSCTLISAMPVGAMTGIVATEFNCAPEYATKAMLQSMLAMIITLPLWIFIIQF